MKAFLEKLIYLAAFLTLFGLVGSLIYQSGAVDGIEYALGTSAYSVEVHSLFYDGSAYKTNFWDDMLTYPFYVLLALFIGYIFYLLGGYFGKKEIQAEQEEV